MNTKKHKIKRTAEKLQSDMVFERVGTVMLEVRNAIWLRMLAGDPIRNQAKTR